LIIEKLESESTWNTIQNIVEVGTPILTTREFSKAIATDHERPQEIC
jgi:hypothetical protein